MQKADRRIKPHRLACAATLMAQQRIDERQQRIHRIARRPPRPLRQAEAGFQVQQRVKRRKIDPRRLPFIAANAVSGIGLGHAFFDARQSLNCLRRAPIAVIIRMIPHVALQNHPRVADFRRHDAADDFAAFVRIVGDPILLAAQQHVPALRPVDLREKMVAFRQKRNRDIVLCAERHRLRTHHHAP